MAVDVLLGLQWGDEGKGKIVDFLAPDYDIICRFQGGPNAGHTIHFGDTKTVLHTIPSGVFHPDQINIIGNGVVIDPITLEREIRTLKSHDLQISDKLYVANKAHLILPTHRLLDMASEAAKGKMKIGSTLRGIGPTYMDKTGRNGLRVGDIFASDFKNKYRNLKEKHLGLLKLYPETDFPLGDEEEKWFESLEAIRDLSHIDCEYFINNALDAGKRILAEGAQGAMLDIDFGTYPYVTSSNTITSGVCNGLGVSPKKIGEVIGISKAYCTRVGSGPFPTELHGSTGEKLRKNGQEFGATTGRPRRCGWLDIPQLKYSCMLTGVTQLAITKIDVLSDFGEVQIAVNYDLDGELTSALPYDLDARPIKPVYQQIPGWKKDISAIDVYADLPDAAKDYLDTLEKAIMRPVRLISTGPERDSLIVVPAA